MDESCEANFMCRVDFEAIPRRIHDVVKQEGVATLSACPMLLRGVHKCGSIHGGLPARLHDPVNEPESTRTEVHQGAYGEWGDVV